MGVMESRVTTILDALGLASFSAGLGAGSAQWVGWWGLAVSGAVLSAGSYVQYRVRMGRPG